MGVDGPLPQRSLWSQQGVRRVAGKACEKTFQNPRPRRIVRPQDVKKGAYFIACRKAGSNVAF
jgi:hypothetical protein